MARTIRFKGAALTLAGRLIKEGARAPDFKAVSQDLKEVSLSDFKGKVKVLTSFPSLDTPVCDMQVKEFNKRAAAFSGDVVIIGISKDLPFAQKRFCQDNEIKGIIVLSDYKYSSCGVNYGLLIKELNLLARSVLIIDKNDGVRYIQISEELTSALDYEAALKRLEDVLKNPGAGAPQSGLPSKCLPCEGGIPALPKERIAELMAAHNGWSLIEGRKITKEFKFKDFQDAKYFLDLVSIVSQQENHHPALALIYNKLKVSLTTHSALGLTENDFIMARVIDELSAE